MEEEVAAFWVKNRIFERSIEERPEKNAFVFYDGPPFATGLPHYGHLLQSAIKDAVPRYKTMQGYRVERRWGWDCHGLPMEALVQKDLKLANKQDIEAYGIGKFNDACAATVLKYADEWKRYVDRLGRWVEFDNAYKTMDIPYTESVWWAFGDLWKKGLIYKDLRVSLYSPSNGTPLSNFEVAMENSYIDVEDPSITIKFKAVGEELTYFLAWTTTPWTLPANIALAVHPSEVYVKVRLKETGETYVFAEKLMNQVLRQFFPLPDGEPPFEIVAKMLGSELAGAAYEPLYPIPVGAEKVLIAREGKTRYQIVAMDYVTMTDGTGIVHTAPAFGEEDFRAAGAHALPVVLTVDEYGNQKPEVPLVGGVFYLDSNPAVVEDLRGRGLLYRSETVVHTVAIFSRNNTRLMYKAQPAWYVNVTKLKKKMLDTAKKISWHPDTFKEGRFGKGLETAPDWCISRARFWGAPLPVWSNADGTDVRVFGSIAELEKAAGIKLDRKDALILHRPKIDDVVFTNANGEEMRRVPDVLDCWFESGSMPYAAQHYPFERKEWFDANFPADFIAEAQDQTRGWFYNLHVLATALFGTPAFKNVIVTGLIMAEDGKKMSKSLKNYPDPWDLMTRLGADSLRMYLLSSPVVQAEQLNFSERDVETVQRTIFGTLWNVRAFYLLAAGTDRIEIAKPRSGHVLDRWLASRLNQLTEEMTRSLEQYDLPGATRPLRAWVDDLSTWWLRRSRDRMKGGDPDDRLDALKTLREALLQTALLLAPFAPFFAERLYQDLEGSKMSVHLDRWPKADPRLIDEQLLADMRRIRAAAAAGHEARASAKIPVRQALALATVQLSDAAEASRLSARHDLLVLLRDELNVERTAVVQGTTPEGSDFHVTLDTIITPELKRKGMGRELVRHAMNLRKALELTPQDPVVLYLAIEDASLRDLFEDLAQTQAEAVKATIFGVGDDLPSDIEVDEAFKVDGRQIRIGAKKG